MPFRSHVAMSANIGAHATKASSSSVQRMRGCNCLNEVSVVSLGC